MRKGTLLPLETSFAVCADDISEKLVKTQDISKPASKARDFISFLTAACGCWLDSGCK
ncbi:hypothetical protein AM571_PB00467 (plasmid) [Rhizobium etli 8C-3]|uniref:Uncharacterized protein n=1 Tax=Rhizobium etli 8C-3 TaxID=538025 RepID=A0A1L5PCA2_RHIET|nr:hypothetical protein AM571_PB00467 [Rhizobium etli 8C-3]ARM15140.1 hypothetical protein Bra5_PB00395 [Rhizobium phaseoli Brasil 5]ARO27090.1 hypothetical protein TAL182_PC00492 [Rhizobium sp. TAL182]ARQ60962.1 hypothetical protein Kim5_PA00502 [Rhizobium sp. Kim5]